MAKKRIFYNIELRNKDDERIKKEFLIVCKQNDSEGPREIRKFMKDYVKKNKKEDIIIEDEVQEIKKEVSPPPLPNGYIPSWRK